MITKCPGCDGDGEVTDSRQVRTRGSIRRRRRCLSCGLRWTSEEISYEEYHRFLSFQIRFKEAWSTLTELFNGDE